MSGFKYLFFMISFLIFEKNAWTDSVGVADLEAGANQIAWYYCVACCGSAAGLIQNRNYCPGSVQNLQCDISRQCLQSRAGSWRHDTSGPRSRENTADRGAWLQEVTFCTQRLLEYYDCSARAAWHRKRRSQGRYIDIQCDRCFLDGQSKIGRREPWSGKCKFPDSVSLMVYSCSAVRTMLQFQHDFHIEWSWILRSNFHRKENFTMNFT